MEQDIILSVINYGKSRNNTLAVTVRLSLRVLHFLGYSLSVGMFFQADCPPASLSVLHPATLNNL